MAIYSIKNLTFKYKNSKNYALHNISLEIEEGGFYIICGKSGSGKSTLLKMMKKELLPNGDLEGEVIYNGKQISQLNGRVSCGEIGFLLQDIDSGLVCDKVWKELAFGLGNLGYDDNYIGSKVAEVSEYFGISKWYNRKISELSGGSKQIVSLASIMTLNPKVLLLDEPTSMLDPIAKNNFANLLSRINKELGITIVVVEHNMDSVYDLATYVIVMDNGEISANTTPDKLPSVIKAKDFAKYIGLPEFAEIFSKVGGEQSMPHTHFEQRQWLIDNFYSKIKTSHTNENRTEDYQKQNVLTAKDLYFRYDKKAEDIIKGATIELYKGEIVCLLGGNGGGKTTFINLLSRVYKPYSGKIKMDNNLRIAMLPQNAKGLFVENSVLEELMSTAKLLGKDKALVNDLIEKFELSYILDNHPYDISGGEVQKLALAKLFLTEPDIIILDEPTQGMDTACKEYLRELLTREKANGKSVIVVTHDLRFASEVGDRIGLFFDGKILSLSSAEEFFANNSFYTTESGWLSKGYLEDCYTADRLVNALKELAE
ncbi:MAG: ATP-binding cassette domain-containing protein [Clostridia bacterium]|nr:ATP-binding cassette domain-containing protein [Clostridia bacterium]